MTLKPDFNLHDAFNIFDHHRTGSISRCDLRDGLTAIGVFPTTDEVDLLFKRYGSERINFREFSNAFVP